MKNEPQIDSIISGLVDGGFAVVWTDLTYLVDHGVRVQLFNVDGSKRGTDFLVGPSPGSSTTVDQGSPGITALVDGRFVVTWSDAVSGIKAQVFQPDGSPGSAEFLIAGGRDSSIVSTSDGHLLVAWVDANQTSGDSSGTAVMAQVLNAGGSPVAPAFLVNTTTGGNQSDPFITVLSGARFVVAWVDGSQSGGDVSGSAVRGQVFQADGSAIGAEFLVNTHTDAGQTTPVITALADGRFVVSWTDELGDSSQSGVKGQLFQADGMPDGAEFLINTHTDAYQSDPGIAALPDGGFVVVWTDAVNPNDFAAETLIKGQVFNADGSKSAEEFELNLPNSAVQGSPAIAVMADGRFVVSWSDFLFNNWLGVPSGLAAQIFDPRPVAVNLAGSDVAEHWIGTAWADTMDGAAGNDTLEGGLGDDRYVLDGLDDRVIETADGGRETVSSATISLDLGRVALANVENAELTGTLELRLTGTASSNVLTGNGAANSLLGLEGDDTLIGGAGNDLLDGDSGNDLLNGGVGVDLMSGGAGDDTLFGATGNDFMSGGQGNDDLNGGLGADTLAGGAGNDRYTVDTLNDRVIEYALEGSDLLISSLISLNLANYANVENASLTGALALGITGSAGANSLTGNNAANSLLGLGGNDALAGGAGADALDGGAGLDTLSGGTGKDLLTGGTEADRLVWHSKAEAGVAVSRDVVTDFVAGVDKLDFSAIDANEALAGVQHFSFMGGAAFDGQAGQLRYTVSAGVGVLTGYTNAGSAADFQIQLTGAPALSATDFI